MNKQVTVQAVAGAIRATEGVNVSRQFNHKGSRSVRSTGIYTKKRADGRIELDYWTSNYEHHKKNALVQLPKVIETLKAKGFDVIERDEPGYIFRDRFLEVVAA